ncbi:MAG: ankyrin repeat domain-containing protein [Bdellovibrionales bacterium]|nr:ankyrin repeat domain-containing protein [Bdellovibrionales bacterium]
MVRLLALFIASLLFLTACKSGDGGGGNPPPLALPDGLFNPDDFNIPLSEEKCASPGPIGPSSSWVEIFIRDIRFGDAACVKRDIQLGKIDVNVPLKEFGQSAPALPIWMALRSSSLFFASSKNGNFAVVKTLVEAGADINVKNSSGETPLHHALQNDEIFIRYPKVAAYLILSGLTDDKSYNANGETAFHVALRRKSAAHIKLFVDKKVDINIPMQNGQKSFLVAINSDVDQSTLEFLLASGIDHQIKDQQGNSALYLAISKKHESLARALIVTHKVNVNELNHLSETPLLQAISSNLSPTIHLLLDNNAMVDLRPSATTALHVAIEKQNASVVDRLIERVQKFNERNQAQQTVMHLLASQGTDQQLTRAIARGFARDEKDVNGDTPLSVAVAKDLLARTQILIDAGANPNSQDNKGQTVLSKARSRAVAEPLVQNKASLNVEDNRGYTAMSNFIALGNAELVNYILESGADFKWAHKASGENYLMEALRNNHLSIAQQFLERQLDPNSLDQNKQNAVFYVKSTEALELLARYNGNFNQLRMDKKSFFAVLIQRYLDSSIMASQDTESLIMKITELGADVNWTTVDGKNALHLLLPQFNTPFDGVYPAGPKKLLSQLLAKGINLGQKEFVTQSTPLHLVNDVDELQLLLQFNPPLKAVNKDKYTAKEEKKYELHLVELDIKGEAEKLQQLRVTLEELKKQNPPKNVAIQDLERQIDQKVRLLRVLEFRASHLKMIIATLDGVGG